MKKFGGEVDERMDILGNLKEQKKRKAIKKKIQIHLI